MNERSGSGKSADAYRTIGEVAEELKLPQHVLRFWETRFPQIKPLKRAGGRRFYRPDDVALLRAIKAMLYGQGYTIKGVQRLLQDQGPRSVAASLSASMSDVVAASPDPMRVEPPHAPTDRPVERDGDRDPSPGRRAAEPLPPRVPNAAPGRPHRPSTSPTGVLDRLDAVARDLSECTRLLAAARAIDDRR